MAGHRLPATGRPRRSGHARGGSGEDDVALINGVGAWILSRFDDPYQGMRREPGFDNLWYGPVPGTLRGGEQVTCSYMIVESGRVVYGKSIATLSLP